MRCWNWSGGLLAAVSFLRIGQASGKAATSRRPPNGAAYHPCGRLSVAFLLFVSDSEKENGRGASQYSAPRLCQIWRADFAFGFGSPAYCFPPTWSLPAFTVTVGVNRTEAILILAGGNKCADHRVITARVLR